MLADVSHVTLDIVFLLLAVAAVLFVLAALVRVAKPWMVPTGLACVAMAILIEWKW